MRLDLLLEIGTEELPSLAVETAVEQLTSKGRSALEEARLGFDELHVYATPRRLTLHAANVAARQSPIEHEMKGPAKVAAFADDGTPQPPAIGFAKSQGVAVEDLIVKSIGTGEYVFAVKAEAGRPAAELLPQILSDLVEGLSFAKSMRWGNGDFRFARPVRWLVGLFGSDVVEFEIDGLRSGRRTNGHRLLAPGAIEISDAADYFAKMEGASVIVDQARRAELIRGQATLAAAEVGAKAVLDETTFREVVQLVESPHVVLGQFERVFTALPRDVLVASMQSHQRYFPVQDESGALTANFIVVHNGDPAHDADICRGHERVLRARLADAAFFFEEDKKTPLSQKVERLKGVIYQEKLGSYFDKQERILALVTEITRHVDADAETMAAAQRAAGLCKADLVSEMVVEFPTLQGTMGEVYARTSGENEATARAIGEHYLPRFSGDDLPQTMAGQVLSIADKIDSIVGCFGIGLIPTSSQDPYGLRRQALGVVTIILEKGLPVRLAGRIDTALATYGQMLATDDIDATRDQIVDFFHQRARNFLLANGYLYDLVDAVLASGLDDLPETKRRLVAVTKAREAGKLDGLLTPFGRAKNLSRPGLGARVAEHLLEDPSEKLLLEAVEKAEAGVGAAMDEDDIDGALDALVELRGPVDKFFDDVLVMTDDEDVRDNRLRLLNRCVAVFERIADFSKVVQT